MRMPLIYLYIYKPSLRSKNTIFIHLFTKNRSGRIHHHIFDTDNFIINVHLMKGLVRTLHRFAYSET